MRGDPLRTHPSSIDAEAPFSERLEAARDGKAWALAALYRTLHAKLLRYLAGREPNAADGVARRVWQDVSAGLPYFEGGESEFAAWVFSLAREQLAQAQAVGLDDVEAHALRRFDRRTQAALRTLASLPEDEADVFLLRAVAGLTTEEIARIVGKPRPVVQTLQQRAVERLVRSRADTRELVA